MSKTDIDDSYPVEQVLLMRMLAYARSTSGTASAADIVLPMTVHAMRAFESDSSRRLLHTRRFLDALGLGGEIDLGLDWLSAEFIRPNSREVVSVSLKGVLLLQVSNPAC